MKLFLILVSLNVVLALAVAGFVHIRRNETGITITIETGALWWWIQAIWEACRELTSNTLRRRSHSEKT